MLRRASDRRKRIDLTSFADVRPAVDIDMRHELASAADTDMFPDDGIRPDRHIRTELCLRMHNSRWMNLHVASGFLVLGSVLLRATRAR